MSIGLSACGQLRPIETSAAGASEGDGMKDFRGRCRAEFVGVQTLVAFCHVEDMGAPGWNNRFRVILSGLPLTGLPRPLPRTADYVRAEITTDGALRVAAPLVGCIEIMPRDKAVRQSYRDGAPAWEVRPQRITLSYLPGNQIEILVEEPTADFSGQWSDTSPSADWLLANRDAMAFLSHAK